MTKRFLLGLLAVGGSAAYAASFHYSGGGGWIAQGAEAVAVAAGISWILFGLALLAATRCRPSVLPWADACLVCMAVGIAILGISIVLNLLKFTDPGIHAGVLVASNLAMGTVFVFRARPLGLSPAKSIALWFLVLDGTFFTLWTVMR